MPSPEHQAVVDLVQDEPPVAAKLLRNLFKLASVPDFDGADIQSADLSQLQPTEYRADSVVALTNARGDPVAAVVVEVQRSCDDDKRFSWPVYVTTLRSRLKVPTWLVVIACDAKTADWAQRPIHIGHTAWILCPLVLGPENIPVVTDAGQATEHPWLASLSALTHQDHEQRDAIFRALLDGVKRLGSPGALRYVHTVQAGLSGAAFKHLEALVSSEPKYKSTFLLRAEARAEAKAEARAEAKVGAKAIITVLTTRGIKVSKDVSERIESCTEGTQLTDWLQRAVTVLRADDLFA